MPLGKGALLIRTNSGPRPEKRRSARSAPRRMPEKFRRTPWTLLSSPKMKARCCERGRKSKLVISELLMTGNAGVARIRSPEPARRALEPAGRTLALLDRSPAACGPIPKQTVDLLLGKPQWIIRRRFRVRGLRSDCATYCSAPAVSCCWRRRQLRPRLPRVRLRLRAMRLPRRSRGLFPYRTAPTPGEARTSRSS